MRLRLGLIVGFGAGYYLGSMAGRERHEQINRLLRKAKRSDAYEVVTDKAKAAADLGVERAKDLVDSAFNHDTGNHDTGSSNPVSPAEAGPLARSDISGRS